MPKGRQPHQVVPACPGDVSRLPDPALRQQVREKESTGAWSLGVPHWKPCLLRKRVTAYATDVGGAIHTVDPPHDARVRAHEEVIG